MDIKRLGPADLRLFREMNALFADAFDDAQTYSAAPLSDHQALRLLARSECVFLVACEDGRGIGAIAGYLLPKFEQDRSELYIYDLAVAEPQRRKGVATQMIEALQPIAKDAGAWVIYVQADPEDAAAVGLYDSLGTKEDVLHFDIPVSVKPA